VIISCSSYNQIIRVSCDNYDVSETDQSVREWAEKNAAGDVYFAKRVDSKGLETYYVHLNEIPIDRFGVSNHGANALDLEVKLSNDIRNSSKIHEIVTINKKAKYLLVNGVERIDTSTILLLNSK
jgi:hypothetical protein